MVIRPLAEIPIDSEGDRSEGEFVELDVAMDVSDEDNGLERMEGVIVP